MRGLRCYNLHASMSGMNGQTVLITGAASGIGRGTPIEMNNFSQRVFKPLLATRGSAGSASTTSAVRSGAC
jgi:short-subunit dehydrogenase involved in D-alanine esterification of teichoic acids